MLFASVNEACKILAGGIAVLDVADNSAFAFARYRKNGALDQTFHGSGPLPGTETESFTTGFDELGDAMAIQGNGKILMAGVSGGHFAVLRLLADGGLDGGFSAAGTPGVETTDFPGSYEEAKGIVIQPSGSSVAAGFTNDNAFFSGLDFAMARYHGGG